jgi:hypothetical protein
MHIVSRCWKEAVNDLSDDGAAGGCRSRAPIKRKAADAQVSRVILLVEDVGYLYKKDKTLRKHTISLQLGHSQTLTGCIDTRFEWTIDAQRNIIGSTIVGDQIREVFQVASGRPAAEGVANGVAPKRVAVGRLRAVLAAGPNEIGSDGDDPSARRFRAGSRDVWELDNWNLPSSDASTLSLVNFYTCYDGSLILPQIDAVHHYLNPDGLSRQELKQLDALPRPDTCKVTALTPEKNLGLLLDLTSRKLLVREVVFENVGWLLVKPFLHFVELRVDGIFFRMHTEIEKHLAIVDALRMPEDDERSTEDVLKVISRHSESLSFGVRMAMHYAAHVFEGDDSFGWQVIGEFAAKYGDYAKPQFEDWFGNPAFMLARLNSAEGGPAMAQELTKLAAGKGGALHVRLAEYLHTTAHNVELWLADPNYHGPLEILVDPQLKAMVKAFGEQSLALSFCAQFDPLRQRLLQHYNMLRPANAMGEEWVKYYKALLAQQVGKGIAWCEVKLRSIIRTRIIANMGNALAPPTMEELQEWRKANGHSDSRRVSLPPRPPLDLPPPITFDGEESDESGLSEEEEEEEEDLATLSNESLKDKLRAKELSTSGNKKELVERLQQAEDDGGDDDESGGEEDAVMLQETDGEENLWALSYRDVQRRLKELEGLARASNPISPELTTSAAHLHRCSSLARNRQSLRRGRLTSSCAVWRWRWSNRQKSRVATMATMTTRATWLQTPTTRSLARRCASCPRRSAPRGFFSAQPSGASTRILKSVARRIRRTSFLRCTSSSTTAPGRPVRYQRPNAKL